MRSRRGFTIIELLIVITIICVLVSILLPAINKLKQSAAQLTCLSYLRLLAGGVISYTVWSYWQNYPNFGRLWCYPLNANGHP